MRILHVEEKEVVINLQYDNVTHYIYILNVSSLFRTPLGYNPLQMFWN